MAGSMYSTVPNGAVSFCADTKDKLSKAAEPPTFMPEVAVIVEAVIVEAVIVVAVKDPVSTLEGDMAVPSIGLNG